MVPSERRRQTVLLALTVLAALVVTAGIAAVVVVADPRAGLAEGIKTGGLAGAAVVALYGLWLNDRRRRIEEDRQAVEEERLRTDGGRVSHERFARAVELLGNEADQVRVGAVHALVGLARDTPTYTQTVLDVLCAYLRRPFFHHAYERHGHDPDRNDYAESGRGRLTEQESAEDRERQVRLTAQRVLLDLLPARDGDGPAWDLDLTGASLEYLDLEDRRIGTLLARRATFHGITRLAGVSCTGRAMFTGSLFRGRVELSGARFGAGLSLERVRFDHPVDLRRAVFADFADLRWLEPATVDLDGATAGEQVRLKLQPGSEVRRVPG